MIPELGRFLDKGTAAHSSILTWRIPRIEETGGLYTVHGVTKELETNKQLTLSLCICGSSASSGSTNHRPPTVVFATEK